MAGQQQSPLQERDRRFDSGSLQQGVSISREFGCVEKQGFPRVCG
jgi:hypothetical protein